MSYLTQDTIANNTAMIARVSQAAVSENIPNGESWAYQNRRHWAAAPGWDDAWESYLVSNPESDPGKDESVITDGMILSQIQSMTGA